MSILCDDVVDDDDEDVLTLLLIIAHFPEIVPVLTKQAETKRISMAKNKQVRSRAYCTIIPVRKANGKNKLWYTIPYHYRPNNARNISIALSYVHSKKWNRKKKSRIGSKTKKSKGGNKVCTGGLSVHFGESRGNFGPTRGNYYRKCCIFSRKEAPRLST